MKGKEYYFYDLKPDKIKGLKNCTVYYSAVSVFDLYEVAKIIRHNNITLERNFINKPLPPKPPRSICKSYKHYVAGIVSPSLYMCRATSFDKTEEEREYFYEVNKYNFKGLLFDLAKRKISKERYKRLRQIMRANQSKILLHKKYLIAINYNNLYE